MGHEPKKLKEIMEKEALPWRSFAGGDAVSGSWNNPGTPGYFVLDHKGVIRYRWVGNPGEHAIDTALEKLISETEKKR